MYTIYKKKIIIPAVTAILLVIVSVLARWGLSPADIFAQITSSEASSSAGPVAVAIEADNYELAVKTGLIKNRLLTEGKISWDEVRKIATSEAIKSEVMKTKTGYLFITGKEGFVEGVIERGRYLVSINGLPGVNISIPAVVDTTKGSSAIVPIKVKKGSGKVEKTSAAPSNLSLIKIAAAAEKDNSTSRVQVVVMTEDNKPLRWAGIKVELQNINQEKTISLSGGWNLVTLAALPARTLTAKGLLEQISQQGGQAASVSTLVDGAWKSYVLRGDKSYSMEDFLIEPGKAYFVKALKPSKFTYSGQNLVAPVKLKLSPGWNAVGMPVLSKSYKAADLNVDTIARWYSGLWDSFVKRNQQEYGENFSILPGIGYILKVGKETEFAP